MRDLIRWGVMLALLLAACNTTPAPATPTALPGTRYTHPGEVFSLQMPPGWAAGDLSQGASIMVSVGPQDTAASPLTVFVVRLETPLDDDMLQAAIATYLAAPYNATLTAIDRAPMPDGSWRITGTREETSGLVPVNVFFQYDGAFFSVLEMPVPAEDPFGVETLAMVVNSYEVNTAVEWPVGEVTAVPEIAGQVVNAGGSLTFSGMWSWEDDLGRFHITGWVANRAGYAVDRVEVRALLFDEDGAVVAEQVTAPALLVLESGEASPFDTRFDGGQPPDAVRYELRVTAEVAGDSLTTYLGAAAFDWDDTVEYDDAGVLHVLGNVSNITDQQAVDVQVIVTVLDEQERVVGYTLAETGLDFIEPGVLLAYDAPLTQLGGPAAQYLVTVQGRAGS